MRYFSWSVGKNSKLQEERNVSFEEVVFHIQQGDLLAVLEHHNPDRYPGQRIFVVNIDDYAYLVPSVETQDEIILKAVIPSRRVTREYLR